MNFSDCDIWALLVFMYGCDRETVFVDCAECDEGKCGIHCEPCYCVKENTESCNNSFEICTRDPQTGSCTCRTGWTGKKCDEDVNECLSIPCDGIAECHYTAGSIAGVCPPGYSSTPNIGCEDIDEFEVNSCSQNMVCTKGPGSYIGECKNGYQLVDGVCTECPFGTFGDKCEPCECAIENTEGCNTTENVCACERSNGMCFCKEGWAGHHCDEDVDECQGSPCDPIDECVNTVGSYLCLCGPDICPVESSPSRFFSGITVSFTQPVVYALIAVGIVFMCIIGLLYKLHRYRHSGEPGSQDVIVIVAKYLHDVENQSHDNRRVDTYSSKETIGRNNPYMDPAQQSVYDDPYFPLWN